MPAREEIIEQSMRMFLKDGLRNVRMDDIASQLGMSKRTLYEMFGSREELIEACVTDYYERQKEEQNREMEEAAQKYNVIERMMMLFGQWESIMVENINFMRQLQRYYPQLYEKLTEKNQDKGMETLIGELRQGVEQGLLLSEINIEFSAQVLAESIRNIFMNPSLYDRSNISIVEAFKYIIIYFFRGISTNKGRRLIDKERAERFPRKNEVWNKQINSEIKP